MEQLMEFLNSTAGQGLIHALGVMAAAWVIGKILTKKPEWEKYRGTLAWACKQAEEMIPDNHENKNYARFDTALKIATEALENRDVNVTAALIDSFKMGIDIVHRDMETRNKLPVPEPELDNPS